MPHTGPEYPKLTLTFFKFLILSVLAMSAGKTNQGVYAQTEEKVVAVVNGRKITQSEVDKSVAAQLIPLLQQISALRKTALDNLVARTILETEAKKRGISVEDLKRELTAAKVEVLQSDIEQEYAENRAAFGAMSEDEAKERLRLDFESEARMQNYRTALSKLKESAHIELSLAEPALPVAGAVGGTDPSLGGKEAAITIIEFSDFQCPFCKGAQSTLKKILLTYGNDVRLVFKHLPLAIHPQAFSSARAAFCAGEQNYFWQYHDALFASDNLTPETFHKIATQLGLDLPRFKTCVGSERSHLAVLKDVQEARRLGIDGTPTFIINGDLIRGAPNFDDLNGLIARKLKISQLNVPQQ